MKNNPIISRKSKLKGRKLVSSACMTDDLLGSTILIPWNSACYQVEIFEKGKIRVDYNDSNCSNPTFGSHIVSVYHSSKGSRVFYNPGDDGWWGLINLRSNSKLKKSKGSLKLIDDDKKLFKVDALLPNCWSGPSPMPSKKPSSSPSYKPTKQPTTSRQSSNSPTIITSIPTAVNSDDIQNKTIGAIITNQKGTMREPKVSFIVTLASSLGAMTFLGIIAAILILFVRKKNRKKSTSEEFHSHSLDEVDFVEDEFYTVRAENEYSINKEGIQDNVVTSELFISPNVPIPDDNHSFFDSSTIQTYSTSVYGKRRLQVGEELRHDYNTNQQFLSWLDATECNEQDNRKEKPIPKEISLENFSFSC